MILAHNYDRDSGDHFSETVDIEPKGACALASGDQEPQDLNLVADDKFRVALEAEQSIPEDWKQATLELLKGNPEPLQKLSKGASDDPPAPPSG